jgi:excisionase family DNA binding protein
MDELLTTQQVAAILQLSPKTVKDWLRAGKLTGYKIGRVWRVKEADLEAFIRGSRVSPPQSPSTEFVTSSLRIGKT